MDNDEAIRAARLLGTAVLTNKINRTDRMVTLVNDYNIKPSTLIKMGAIKKSTLYDGLRAARLGRVPGVPGHPTILLPKEEQELCEELMDKADEGYCLRMSEIRAKVCFLFQFSFDLFFHRLRRNY